jgi:hypothetical protein
MFLTCLQSIDLDAEMLSTMTIFYFCLCISESTEYISTWSCQAAGHMHGREDHQGPTNVTATGYDLRHVSFQNIDLILCGQISLKDESFGSRFSSTIELRIPNSSLESIIGVGGVNLVEIRQV